MINIKRNNQRMEYPRALAKQLVDWPTANNDHEADFKISINTNHDWNLIPNLNWIQKNLIDLEIVVIHELTHGLGFTTALVHYEHSDSKQSPYLAPVIFLNYPTNKIKVKQVSVFDSLVHCGTNTFMNVIRGFENVIVPVDGYKAALENTSEFMIAGHKLYELAKSKQLYIPLQDESKVQLDTEERMDVAHLHRKYLNTADTIMTPFSLRGQTMNSIMRKYNMESIYGPNTRGILELMGYDFRSNRKRKATEMSEVAINPNHNDMSSKSTEI